MPRKAPVFMRKLAISCLTAAATLAACSQFPELQDDADLGSRDAPYPQLVPVETLRAQAPQTAVTPESQAALEARITRLRNRAMRLKGTVVDGGTRARMSQGVNQP
ncbi:hypothetical protein FDP25_03785 [Roseovarius sp. A21]|uniref:Beta-barrel assembly machine subunit BamF n=1 Tax=Roseovarius bejariae TaxID=2576383 RepID=A0A844CIN5_9RHOB|nr:hypothetical protein [Roseovarius bejariae]MRU14547.1 hypothetical protein [Roseovarius bejariae]